jgi:y4mF family transcriptional regulator
MKNVKVRTIRDLGAIVRGRRRELGLAQAELARRAGVSRKWVYEFEAGKATAELGLVLRVLDALDLQLEARPAARRTKPRAGASVDLDVVLDRVRRGGQGGLSE